jgi:hypothetical protein
MSFPINTAIPNLPNNPVNDVPLMKTNFTNISGFLAVDHVAAGATNAGIHNQVHFVNESAPGLIGTGGVLYANVTAGNSFPFWQNALGIFPLLSPVTASTSGMITIPGGIILQWGFVNTTFASSGSVGISGNVLYPTSFPANTFIVLTTAYYPNNATSGSVKRPSDTGTVSILSNVTQPANTGFTWSANSNSSQYTGFYWFAVGN